MEIVYRRPHGSGTGWESVPNPTPEEQDIAKRILWQPEDVNSSLGRWIWDFDTTYKAVFFRERHNVDTC